MKLIYLVTEDWYFYSHRMPMVRAAQRAGFDVAVITNIDRHRDAIEAQGVRVIDFSLERRSLNPIKAVRQIIALARIYRAEKPELVHHIAMKPVLYGSLAAWMVRVPRVINAFAGLGFLFTAQTVKAHILRMGLYWPFRFLLRRSNSYTLLQNRDDRNLLMARGMIAPDSSGVIRGSGIDLDAYPQMPLPESGGDVVCVFAGRMIDIKGLPTLQAAFSLLEQRAPHIKLWLCGQPDSANPGSWNEARLRDWERRSSNVTYKGPSTMIDIWRQTHIGVQPSYGGEGVPKALLEAASCGRAVVATAVPGCREVVEDGRNGYLVPAHDAEALAAAIEKIAADREKCAQMGRESRKLVASDLSAEAVSQQVEILYRDVMDGRKVAEL